MVSLISYTRTKTEPCSLSDNLLIISNGVFPALSTFLHSFILLFLSLRTIQHFHLNFPLIYINIDPLIHDSINFMKSTLFLLMYTHTSIIRFLQLVKSHLSCLTAGFNLFIFMDSLFFLYFYRPSDPEILNIVSFK